MQFKVTLKFWGKPPSPAAVADGVRDAIDIAVEADRPLPGLVKVRNFASDDIVVEPLVDDEGKRREPTDDEVSICLQTFRHELDKHMDVNHGSPSPGHDSMRIALREMFAKTNTPAKRLPIQSGDAKEALRLLRLAMEAFVTPGDLDDGDRANLEADITQFLEDCERLGMSTEPPQPRYIVGGTDNEGFFDEEGKRSPFVLMDWDTHEVLPARWATRKEAQDAADRLNNDATLKPYATPETYVPAVRERYCVDGHEFPNLESSLMGDGQFPPFYVFDIKEQGYVANNYPTREEAQAVADRLNADGSLSS